jgi:hypothetical protein
MPSSIVFTAAAALCLASVFAQTPLPVTGVDLSLTSKVWCAKPELNDTIEVPPCLDDGNVAKNVDADASTYAECRSNEELAARRFSWVEDVLGCFANPKKPMWYEVNWTCLFEKLGVPFPDKYYGYSGSGGHKIPEDVRISASYLLHSGLSQHSPRIVMWLSCSVCSDLEHFRCSSIATLSRLLPLVRAPEP